MRPFDSSRATTLAAEAAPICGVRQFCIDNLLAQFHFIIVMRRSAEGEFFIDNPLVRIHCMIKWTGLAPWHFESPFPGSLTSTFLKADLRNTPTLNHSHARREQLKMFNMLAF
jgi:hypothetical protein